MNRKFHAWYGILEDLTQDNGQVSGGAIKPSGLSHVSLFFSTAGPAAYLVCLYEQT